MREKADPILCCSVLLLQLPQSRASLCPPQLASTPSDQHNYTTQLIFLHLSSLPLQPVMLGHMEQVAPASSVLPTVTAHRVGHLCALALRGTTELLRTLLKWNVLVSLMLLFYDESRACSAYMCLSVSLPIWSLFVCQCFNETS